LTGRCLLPKIGGLSVTSVGTEENIRNNDNAWKSFAAPWNKYDDISIDFLARIKPITPFRRTPLLN
jgi:hypothetical protein